jgi:hypothetical protein
MIAYFVFNMILVVLLLRVLVFCEFSICYQNTSFWRGSTKTWFCSISFIKVCEISLSGAGAASNPGAASQFVRAEMLPSGYLVWPCEGGGSVIHIVDHVNLEVINHP